MTTGRKKTQPAASADKTPTESVVTKTNNL